MRLPIFKLVLLLAFNLMSSIGQGQNRCSDSLKEKFEEKVPIPADAYTKSIKAWKEKRKTIQRSSVVVTIPVHVIIVHASNNPVGVGDNLSMERIQSQIDVLNVDFGGTNSDIINVPSEFDVGRSDISFCLASVDADGNPTNGVTRYPFDGDYDDSFFDIMPETIWNNSQYLNIYVSATIDDLGFSPVANTEFEIPPIWDAPSVLTTSFGGPGFATQTNYDLGRTTVHEIGHWLGLNHLWGPSGGGCSEDDGIDDTPTQAESTFFCPDHPQPACTEPAKFFMNFMDYVDDDCMLAFSAQQVDYMHFIIEEVRPGLIGAHLTKCQDVVTPDPIVPTLLSSSDESCAGANNGSVDITASGGTPPFSYSLDGVNFQSSGLFNNLSGGNYTAFIRDAFSGSSSINFSIGTAAPIFVEVVAVTSPCSGLSNGSFGVVATGGNPGALSVSLNQSITDPNNFFSNLSAGIYTISVTDSQNCQEEIQYELVPSTSQIVIDIINVVNPCNNNGSFQVQTNPANANVVVNQSMTDPNNTFDNLGAGIYTIVATDNDGCSNETLYELSPSTSQITFDIIEVVNPCDNVPNGSFQVQTNPSNASIVVNQTITDPNNTFNNLGAGIYTIAATDSQGCIEEFQYELSPTTSLISIDVFDVTNPCGNNATGSFSVSADGFEVMINQSMTDPNNEFNNLTAGVYTITAIDSQNCIEEIEYELMTADNEIMINVFEVVNPCANGSNGSFQVQTAPSNASITINQTLVDPNNQFNNLAAGSYLIAAEDAQGCISEMSFDLAVDTDPFDPIQVDIIYPSGNDCETSPNSVRVDFISNPNDGIVEISLDNGMISNIGMFTGLSQGTFEYTISNNQGCQETGSFTIEADYYYDVDYQAEDPTCFNALDGSLVYSNFTDLPITMELSAGSANGPNSYINIPVGSHTASVFGMGGCLLFEENILFAADEIIETGLSINPDCSTGLSSINFTASGGNGALTYQFNGSTNNTGQFENLNAGSQTMLVTDAMGCSATFAIDIFPVDEEMVVNTTVDEESLCFGETTQITIQVTGGAPPYEYIYNGVAQSSNIIQNVGGGLHSIQVLSSGNCSDDFETQIEVIEYEELIVENVEIIDSECSSEGGFFEANIFDGSQPYYYVLDQTDTILVEELPRLGDGPHSIQVIDSEGCSSELFEFNITVSEPVSVDLNIINQVSCYGLNNGRIELNVQSSIGISSYDWNIEGVNPTQLAAGEYSVTVTNPDDCFAIVEFEITEPDSLVIASEILTPAGNLSGSAEFTVEGGTPPYQFNVGGIENEDGYFSLLQGDYTVDIRDANGCSFSHDFTITLETSIEDVVADLGIMMMPNPAKDYIRLTCLECDTNSKFKIINPDGKELAQGFIQNQLTLNVQDFTPGFYLMVMEVKGQVVSYKFIVI